MTHPLFGFLFLFFLLLFDAEEIAEAVEVFLHDEAETLRVQTVARKIAVVGLIVHAYGEVAVREDEVTEVEIADETLRGIRIVTITELTIEEQAVVEQLATQNALILGIVETFITVDMLAPKFQLLLFTTLESTVLSCCEMVPLNRLCIASDV